MKCQKNLAGYTIIEVLIFLTISSAIMISAGTLVSGQQQRTQFTTGVRDFESKMQDLINDVENGYTPNNGSIRCTVDYSNANSAPAITAAANEQGKNEDCVFLGQAIQFYRGASGYVSGVRSMTIAGKRLDQDAEGKLAQPVSLEASNPRAFYISTPGSETGVKEAETLNNIEVSSVRYITDFSPYSTDQTLENVAVIQSVALQETDNVSTNLVNGRVSLTALDGSSNFDDSTTNLVNSISSLNSGNALNPNNTFKGLVICLRDASGGRVAALGFGVRLEEVSPGSFVPRATDQNLSSQTFFDNQAELLGCTSS